MNRETICVKRAGDRFASCNSCFARNHGTPSEADAGEKVADIYEICIGGCCPSLLFCLCRDCLSKLAEEAYLAINPASEAMTEEVHEVQGVKVNG